MAGDAKLKVKRRGDLSLSNEALSAILLDVIKKGRPVRFKAKGFSMSPFLKDGDVLTVSPLAGRPLRTGDIVVIRHPSAGTVAVHRVVRRSSGSLVLKGDNSPEADGLFSSGSVVGIVTGVERAGRPVRLGTGPLRGAVAILSGAGVLDPFLRRARGIIRRWRRGG